MTLFYLRIRQIWCIVTRNVLEYSTLCALAYIFYIDEINYATNIYNVHFTTLILQDFFQMYVSIPNGRFEIKTANCNYWNAKGHREILLLSINLSRGKKWRKLSYDLFSKVVVCLTCTAFRGVCKWMSKHNNVATCGVQWSERMPIDLVILAFPVRIQLWDVGAGPLDEAV
jgi:hypothetical protein